MKEIHLRLAEIGLRVASRYGFALAGGYAVQAHGILARPSEDVDLFTAWERRGEFATAVDAIVDAYRVDGYAVEVMQQFDTFARLAVTDPAIPEHPYKVELAANWRAQPPVMMDIGPVLHVDDVVAGKMSALFTRAEPRDFLDVDAALTTGRYTREQLLELAEQADADSIGVSWQIFLSCLHGIRTVASRPMAPIPGTSLPCGNASHSGVRSFSPTWSSSTSVRKWLRAGLETSHRLEVERPWHTDAASVRRPCRQLQGHDGGQRAGSAAS